MLMNVAAVMIGSYRVTLVGAMPLIARMGSIVDRVAMEVVMINYCTTA